MGSQHDESRPVNACGPVSFPASPIVDGLTPSQASVHNNFVVSARALKTAWLRTVFYLETVYRLKIHRLLGYRTIGEYAGAVAGFSAHMTTELLSLARRLPSYGLVAEALEAGSLTWTQAREICAKTDPADQQYWLAAAAALPREVVRRAMAEATARGMIGLESGVRGESGGDGLPVGGTSGADNALTTAVTEPPAADIESPAADIAPLTMISAPARSTAAGSGAEALAAPAEHMVSYRFSPEQMARWERLSERMMTALGVTKEDAVLCAMEEYGKGDCALTPPPYLVVLLECPDCGRTDLPTNRGEATASAPLLAATQCDAVIEQHDGTRRSILAPRVRRMVFRSGRYRCEAPGCRHTQFLEIHHRIPIAGGGTDNMTNLVLLCSRCHRRLHEAEEQARRALESGP